MKRSDSAGPLITVRAATGRDRASIRHLQGFLSSPSPELVDLAIDTPGKATALVAERDSVVGYVLAFPANTTDGFVIYVAELVIAPAARREGLGTRLLTALTERKPESDELRVTVREDDAGALAFYYKTGFQEVRKLPSHYDDADGVLLTRRLGT